MIQEKENKQTSINLDFKGKFLPAQISTDNITLRTLLEVWTCALGCLIPIEIQNIIL